jgi:hypothetical protein
MIYNNFMHCLCPLRRVIQQFREPIKRQPTINRLGRFPFPSSSSGYPVASPGPIGKKVNQPRSIQIYQKNTRETCSPCKFSLYHILPSPSGQLSGYIRHSIPREHSRDTFLFSHLHVKLQPCRLLHLSSILSLSTVRISSCGVPAYLLPSSHPNTSSGEPNR